MPETAPAQLSALRPPFRADHVGSLLRRESWHMDFIYQLGGVASAQDDTIRVAFHTEDRQFEWAPPSAHGPSSRSWTALEVWGSL